MLVIDRNKIQHLAPNTGAPFAMMRGMGYVDPATFSMIASSMSDVLGKIQEFFGIGSGRREADAITPIQNQIHYEVLAPISDVLDSASVASVSRSQWSELLSDLQTTEDNWLRFLHNTQWSDGRAAIQAEATLAPYFEEFSSEIRSLMVNAPYMSNTDVPDVTAYGETGNGDILQAGIIPSISNGLTQYAPLILAGVALLFLLPGPAPVRRY